MKSETHERESGMRSQTDQFVEDVKMKSAGIVEDTGHCIGGALEKANDKAADLKQRMEEGYAGKISPEIDAAQTKIAGASRYLQEKNFPNYIADLEQFAREHPRITTVVSVIVGWKLGRALTFSK